MMEVYSYPEFSKELSVVHVALFANVQNAAELRTRLIQAASMAGAEGDLERESVNFAYIDARLVRDSFLTQPTGDILS